MAPAPKGRLVPGADVEAEAYRRVAYTFPGVKNSSRSRWTSRPRPRRPRTSPSGRSGSVSSTRRRIESRWRKKSVPRYPQRLRELRHWDSSDYVHLGVRGRVRLGMMKVLGRPWQDPERGRTPTNEVRRVQGNNPSRPRQEALRASSRPWHSPSPARPCSRSSRAKSRGREATPARETSIPRPWIARRTSIDRAGRRMIWTPCVVRPPAGPPATRTIRSSWATCSSLRPRGEAPGVEARAPRDGRSLSTPSRRTSGARLSPRPRPRSARRDARHGRPRRCSRCRSSPRRSWPAPRVRSERAFARHERHVAEVLDAARG